MFHYFFKNVNTLFLTCALAFISIANAQAVYTVDNKGSINTLINPTIAERYDLLGGITIREPAAGNLNRGGLINFSAVNRGTDIQDPDHYETGDIAYGKFIKVKQAGTYRVGYRVTAALATVNTQTASAEYSLWIKYGNIGQFRKVEGSVSTSYHETLSAGIGTASALRILKLAAQSRIMVVGKKNLGGGDILTLGNGSSFLIERIK